MTYIVLTGWKQTGTQIIEKINRSFARRQTMANSRAGIVNPVRNMDNFKAPSQSLSVNVLVLDTGECLQQ